MNENLSEPELSLLREYGKKDFLWPGFVLLTGKFPNHKAARIHLLSSALISQVAVLA